MALPLTPFTFPQLKIPKQRTFLHIRRWAFIILCVLLLHFGILISRMHFLFETSPPKPLDVRTLSPEELEDFKKNWEQNKKFLLKQVNPETNEPVPQARYESDRNAQVEKETRARNTNVIPQEPASAEAQRAQKAQQAQMEKAEAQRKSPKAISLRQLGIKMDLGPPREKRLESVARNVTPRVFEDQSLRENELEEGERNLLNTERSRFYTFYARLYEAIAPLWNSKVTGIFESGRQQFSPGSSYTTLAEVILNPSGELVDVVIVQASGVLAFDNAVIESWRKISRFPNPPRDLIKPDGYVHTGWTFTVDVSAQQGIRFLAPERRY